MMVFTCPVLYLYVYELSDQLHREERTVSHQSCVVTFFCIYVFYCEGLMRNGGGNGGGFFCVQFLPLLFMTFSFRTTASIPLTPFARPIHCFSFHFLPHRHSLPTHVKCYISVNKTVKTKKNTSE